MAGDSSAFDAVLRAVAASPMVAIPVVGPRFEIHRRIGGGGMGVVYEAFDTVRETRVALKTLRRGDAGGVYRLKNEFRSLADVRHPNLVHLHELFAEGDAWFFTMALIDGEPFDSWVRPRDKLDVPRLRPALSQLLAAVDAIHAAGKVHRDLKPNNVLVTADGRVVVLDFGLAVDPELGGIGQTKTDDRVSGTPAYMAPEQAAGARATSASDYYAVGVMLFEALTGALPFAGSVHEVLVDKQRLPAPAASTLARGVPNDLAALCTQLMAREPATRPDGSALRARLVAKASPLAAAGMVRASQPPPAHKLVGRETELAELRQAFAASCTGDKPVIVLVTGESGIGKSALVEVLLSELHAERRAVVLSGRCFERESLPFKGFDAVVDELSRHLRRLTNEQASQLMPRDAFALRRLFPVLGRIESIAQAPNREVVDAHELQRRAFAAFGELLGRMRDRQPLVLHLDDLQWGDIDSTRLLMHVVRQPDAPRLLLIASHRSEQMHAHPCLRPLYEQLPFDIRLDVRIQRLQPLSTTASHALLAQRLFVVPPHSIEEAGGNPFLLGELARHIAMHAGRPTAELTLGHAVMTRVSSLPSPERQLLEVLAVAARPIPLSLAADAAGVSVGTHTLFEVLRDANLARATGDGTLIECFHDKVREPLLQGLTGEQLRDRHRALAGALSRLPHADPEQLAGHLMGGGELQRAAEQLVCAAERASAELGFDRAARLYTQALEHGTFEPARLQHLRVARAEALAEAGRGIVAADAYLDALDGACPRDAVDLRRRAGEQFLYGGQLARGLQLLSMSLHDLGVRVPKSSAMTAASIAYHDLFLRLHGYRTNTANAVTPETTRRIDLLRRAAYVCTRLDPLRGVEFSLRAARLELQRGTARDAALALSRLILCALMLGKDQAALLSAIARAERAVANAPDFETQTYFGFIRGLARYFGPETDPEGALADFDRAVERFSQLALPGSSYNLREAEYYRASTRALMGQLAPMALEVPAHLDEAWHRNDLCLVPAWAGQLSALCGLAIGDVAGVEHRLVSAQAVWSAPVTTRQDIQLSDGQWLLHMYRGRAREASACAEHLVQRLKDSPLGRSSYLQRACTLFGLSAAAVARDLPRGAERAALLRRVARTVSTVSEGERPLLQAALACQRGDAGAAIEALRAARPNWRIRAQAARRRLGVLLGGQQGQLLVDEADTFFRAAGVVDIERYVTMLLPGIEIR